MSAAGLAELLAALVVDEQLGERFRRAPASVRPAFDVTDDELARVAGLVLGDVRDVTSLLGIRTKEPGATP